MSISTKHHYLPEFYLKGFVNEKGQFSIYDYLKKNIKKGEYSLSTHFFEKNRNTIEVSGNKSDFPEKYYAAKDEKYSKLFRLIQSSKCAPTLSTEDLLTLQDFASNLFWRIPKNDALYEKEFLNDTNIKKVWVFKDTNTGQIIENEVTKKIKNSEAFKKAVRTTASDFLFMDHDSKDLPNWKIAYSEKSFLICPDNPLILKNQSSNNLFNTEFVLPLTQNHLLIRTFNTITRPSFSNEFSVWINILLFKQGTLYCAASNRDSLNILNFVSPKIETIFLLSCVFNSFNMQE